MQVFKLVQYGYNSELEGEKPYLLSVLSIEDGEVKLDVQETFGTKVEFDEAIESVVPMIDKRTYENR